MVAMVLFLRIKSYDIIYFIGDPMVLKIFNNEHAFSSNVYVLDGTSIIVIDPGFYDGYFKEYLKMLGRVDAVLLTHGHFDHISGIDDLMSDFPDAKIYVSSDDYEFLTNSYLNASSYFGYDVSIRSQAEKLNEELITIGKHEIEVVKAPGHTRGSVFFFFKKENILFTGDTITAHSIGITHYPTGSDKDMKSTIEKFLNLGCISNTLICPGHDALTTYEDIKTNNLFINDYRKE